MTNEFPEEEVVSKSELKRQMSALQELGQALVAFDEASLSKLPISEALFDAISTAKKIKKHEGLRRQLQFIGKLMRKEPAESIEQIQLILTSRQKGSNEEKKIEHQTEHWRELLLQGGDEAIQRFLASFENADRQWLRQTVRAAKKETENNAPPANSRKLFRYIREQIKNHL